MSQSAVRGEIKGVLGSATALALAIMVPFLLGLSGGKCDCNNGCDSTGGSQYNKPYARISKDGAELSWARDTSGSRRQLDLGLVANSNSTDVFADLTWSPPIGATNFTFSGRQPDNPNSGPPFKFSDVPISYAGPSPDIHVDYDYYSPKDTGLAYDTVIVGLSDGPEAFYLPLGSGKNVRNADAAGATTEDVRAWKIRRWWYAKPAYDLERTVVEHMADLIESGAGFIGIEAPVPEGSDGIRAPIVLKDAEAPIFQLLDYRQDPFDVVTVDGTFAPEHLAFLESAFPPRENTHWSAIGIGEGTTIDLPTDFPFPAGSWQLFGNLFLDLSALEDECDGCTVRYVGCIDNEALQPTVRAALSLLPGVNWAKTSQDATYSCIGPYLFGLHDNPSFHLGGDVLIETEPGDQAAIGFYVETLGSQVTAAWSAESDRGRTWTAYEGDWDGPNLGSPIPEVFSFDELFNVWLVSDIPLEEAGLEAVTLTLDPTGVDEPTQFHTASVLIGEWTPPPAPWSAWIPVGVHAGGANNSQWRTDFGVLNTSGAEAAVTLTVHAADGDHSLDMSVAAGGQLILEDVLASIPFDGAGSMEVTSANALIATSRTYTEIAPEATCFAGGTLGQFLDSSDNVTVLDAGQSAWIPQLSQNDAYRTNIALTNTGPAQAAATVRLYDASGTEVGAYDVELDPGQWEQKNRVYEFFTSSAVPAGYAKVEVTQGTGIIGYGSVVDNTTNDPTTMPMIVTTAAAVGTWIPVAVHASGANRSQWRTDLGLLNPNSADVTVEVVLHASDGNRTMQVNVVAGGQTILQDVVGLLPYDGAASLQVTADAGIVVTSRTYTEIAGDAQCLAGGTLGQFLDSSANGTTLAGGQSARIPQLVQTTRYRTNIALTNTGNAQAAATVHLYDASGTEVGAYDVELDPGQWEQKNRVYEFFTSSDVPAGYALVEVTEGTGIIGYGSVVDNVTNDPTTMPMVP